MFSVVLPDKTRLKFDVPISINDIAKQIHPKFAKEAIAAEIGDQQLVDLNTILDRDTNLTLITLKDPKGIDILRHSTAHLLAHAIKQLFPSAQVAIGPVIENGFYYDFACDHTFVVEDFEAIEKKMKELADLNLPIQREEMKRDDAICLFDSLGESYKVKLIKAIPSDELISLYRQGDYVDLCRGPHVPSTGWLKAFKLTKLAGAYWRGDSNNEMLQRIYGVAFATEQALKDYLDFLAEAEKRDHRKIGKTLDFFHFQEEAPGLPFWHDKGWTLFRTLEEYMRKKLEDNDYQEVLTPLFADRSLWEKTGHWEKYKENMFTIHSENREYAIKPMNCPCHVQIYKRGLKSYRDLPCRIAEFGMVYRNEPSGTLHGLMRTREVCQDDAHVFCTEDQIQGEVIKMIGLVFETYHDFGFSDITVVLATRPDKRIGEDTIWDHGEKALANALKAADIPFEWAPGEGAFYGPKIEFHLRDSIGRDWQLGTIQVDFFMPGRLEAQYVAEDGTRQTPIMIHRAILGSINRFMGVLIEHYAGKLPIWLSPIQVAVINITDEQAEYATEIAKKLKALNIRAMADLRNEKIGFKIRSRTLERIPYLLVVGNREREQQTISVRTREGEDLGSVSIEDFVKIIRADIASYR
jgi:threonyl-tRNA synthetase